MNSSLRSKTLSSCVDDALLAPWAATGRLDAQDARLFAAAMASDPGLADDVAAARTERDAVVALAGNFGRPSPRALAALFEAIDAEELGENVARLRLDRPRAAMAQAGPLRKIGSLR